jgi:hypothetical protein
MEMALNTGVEEKCCYGAKHNKHMSPFLCAWAARLERGFVLIVALAKCRAF